MLGGGSKGGVLTSNVWKVAGRSVASQRGRIGILSSSVCRSALSDITDNTLAPSGIEARIELPVSWRGASQRSA